jgi:hypothetical protein
VSALFVGVAGVAATLALWISGDHDTAGSIVFGVTAVFLVGWAVGWTEARQ